MGNTFGFLHTTGDFQFTVLNACEAEGINLGHTWSLVFEDAELVAIGNVTKGTMKPEPGIVGIGLWLAFMAFFGVILTALLFIGREISIRATRLQSGFFAILKDSNINETGSPDCPKRFTDRLRAAGRTFVFGVADTQTIFVGAFLLSFAGRTKCSLTSYHFTVAVDQMMIALSAMIFSVALVRTYWRNLLAPGFRLLLSIGAFVGVGLTIFRKANYAPDFPPRTSRSASTILLPVACFLESNLCLYFEEQATRAQSELGFGKSSAWPIERIFFIALALAFLSAHISIVIRHVEKGKNAPHRWSDTRRFVTIAYWPIILVPPTVTSIWYWVRVFRTRVWVDDSGWLSKPNTEMTIWDGGQLIAMGVVVTVALNMSTELWKREGKGTRVPEGAEARTRLLDHGEYTSGSESAGSSSTSYPMMNWNGSAGRGNHGPRGYHPVTARGGWYHR